jgi:hypothetical protein
VGEDAETRIKQYYKVVYQREGTEEEIQSGVEYISAPGTNEETTSVGSSKNQELKDPLSKWALYAQALLLSNELIFVD